MKESTMFKIIGAAIGAILGLVVLFSSFYIVDSGERAIVLRTGSVVAVESDGLHFKLPFIERVIITDVRTMKGDAGAEAATEDFQRVATTVSVNYHLDAGALETIYTKTGLDVETKIIDPRIQEVVKAITAKYSAEDLMKKREQVKGEITNMLRVELAKYSIILEATQITNFAFSKAFTDAVENKQVAEQLAAKARNDLERIKVEGEQKIATAKAEAESIKVQSEAVRAQGGKEYVQLKFIEKWDGKLPVYGETPQLMKDVSK